MIDEIKKIMCNMTGFLCEKNKRYGNSIQWKTGIFNKSRVFDQITVRIDDKLARIANSQELRKNDVVDLAGYLILLCINEGWTDFSDLID